MTMFPRDGAAEPTRPRRRVALYSHDTQGLGHIRRNIEVARAMLSADPRTDVLLITGAPQAVNLPRPERTELVVLPAVTKSRGGDYASVSLSLDLEEVLRMRGSLIAAAVTGFRPDLMIVDKEARGLRGELDEALDVASRIRGVGGGRTRLVLGLRDILDSRKAARRDWEEARTSQTLLSSYDAVWVYGDRSVYDPVSAYRLPGEVAQMVHFTGYLAAGRYRHAPAEALARSAPAGPFVLCLVGGGQDGADLARTFTAAAMPAGHRGVVVTGPYMPSDAREEIEANAARRGDITVLGFVDHAPELIRRCAAVVTMVGYNTACELLASRTPGLMVPRVVPRREQAVRAKVLAARTHLDRLDPAETTPTVLGHWLDRAVSAPVPRHDPGPDLDLDGLARTAALAEELLAATPESPRSPGPTDPLRHPCARTPEEATHVIA